MNGLRYPLTDSTTLPQTRSTTPKRIAFVPAFIAEIFCLKTRLKHFYALHTKPHQLEREENITLPPSFLPKHRAGNCTDKRIVVRGARPSLFIETSTTSVWAGLLEVYAFTFNQSVCEDVCECVWVQDWWAWIRLFYFLFSCIAFILDTWTFAYPKLKPNNHPTQTWACGKSQRTYQIMEVWWSPTH